MVLTQLLLMRAMLPDISLFKVIKTPHLKLLDLHLKMVYQVQAVQYI